MGKRAGAMQYSSGDYYHYGGSTGGYVRGWVVKFKDIKAGDDAFVQCETMGVRGPAGTGRVSHKKSFWVDREVESVTAETFTVQSTTYWRKNGVSVNGHLQAMKYAERDVTGHLVGDDSVDLGREVKLVDAVNTQLLRISKFSAGKCRNTRLSKIHSHLERVCEILDNLESN